MLADISLDVCPGDITNYSNSFAILIIRVIIIIIIVDCVFGCGDGGGFHLSCNRC